MRSDIALRLLLVVILGVGCSGTEEDADGATDSAAEDDRTMAEKAGDAGAGARTKAEQLKSDAEAKGKEADAMKE